MKRMAICSLAFLWLVTVQAHGMEAMEYFNLGLESEMTYKKIEYFTKALELDPRLAAAYAKRGLLYYFQEKYDKVIQDYTIYSKLAPHETDAYRMLGMAHLKKGSYDSAIYNFNHAIEMDPNLTKAYTYRAEAYRLSGMYDESIRDSTRAIRLWGDPRTISDAYKTRAKVYWELDQKRLANADFKKSFELDPRTVFYKLITRYASPEDMRVMGLFLLIGIALVLIFRLKLKPPEKK